MSRSMLAILVVCSFSLIGCGTCSDMFCGPIDNHNFYRGVRMDIEAAQNGGADTLMLADIPLSAVADTLLVPIGVVIELTDPPGGRVKWSKEQDAKSHEQKVDSTSNNGPNK
jgi:uncharacterized protein YceK